MPKQPNVKKLQARRARSEEKLQDVKLKLERYTGEKKKLMRQLRELDAELEAARRTEQARKSA